jgi:alkanesulfonate monooxygenase SsuD/methylene tetrahydromethanopterin reductase-like flavin-dependent oxidoreductase (luciferase family)
MGLLAERAVATRRRGRVDAPEKQETDRKRHRRTESDCSPPAEPGGHPDGDDRADQPGQWSACRVESKRLAGVLEPSSQQSRPGAEVETGASTENRCCHAERDERLDPREHETRDAGESHRHDDNAALSVGGPENAAGELCEGVRRPHAGQRHADGPARGRQRSDDVRHDRADDDACQHDTEERADRRREKTVLPAGFAGPVAPVTALVRHVCRFCPTSMSLVARLMFPPALLSVVNFELLLVTQYDPDRNLRDVGDDLRTQVELAREGGLDGVGVSEHHVTGDQYLLNEVVIAHVADAVGDMRLTTALCLLPYHNPVRIAEFGATVDVLTGGQFRLGVGLGYRDAEYDAFGVDRADGPGRLVEGIEVIERLWTEESVSFDGDHFQFTDVTLRPEPMQDPRPPVWVGASNESSVRRGARVADGFLGAHVPFDLARRQVADFRDERASTARGPGDVALVREVYVAETAAAAEATVKEPLMRKYRSYTDWGQDDAIGDDTFESEWEQLCDGRFIVGSPDDVVAEIERYDDAMELDSLFFRTQYPGMDPGDVTDSLELFAEEVAPRVR